MGGTWIRWHMPGIYREVCFYGLHNHWIVIQNASSKEVHFTVTTGDEQRNLSHEEEMQMARQVILDQRKDADVKKKGLPHGHSNSIRSVI